MNDDTARAPGSNRAGRYIPQPEGYYAFVPAPLPPRPPILADGEMQALMSKADRALGRLDGSIQTLPDPDLFIFMYIRKEAVLSSRIEGTESSLDDVLEVEAKIFDRRHPRDVGEVLNYISAMDYGLEQLHGQPFTVRLIQEIHGRLMHGVRGTDKQPGRIRRKQNWIGPPGCTQFDATFVPPPPSEVLPALTALESFLNRAAAPTPPLIEIGLAHAQFETIHPFLDGNGRVGRLLIALLLGKREILIRPVLYISNYFRRHQQHYYDRLQAVRDKGEWEAWLKFFLEGVATVSNEATETARKIVALREEHRAFIVREFGRAVGNGLIVLEHLFEKPIIQVKEIEELLGITYAGANSLTNRLVEAGLLSEVTGHARNRRFRYGAYIGLFAET
jgi:Fic family protein